MSTKDGWYVEEHEYPKSFEIRSLNGAIVAYNVADDYADQSEYAAMLAHARQLVRLAIERIIDS